ncbi:7-carboxy-7-deazaguanine synthase QueE, partial [Pseudomonas sp. RTI1]|nr:7-carboxy-7-deazaguanine synthase QueE [Pseudomonas sp. RTI1]
KFVFCSSDYYNWAVSKLIQFGLVRRAGDVLFSPSHHDLNARVLADWIVAENVPVRLQMLLL